MGRILKKIFVFINPLMVPFSILMGMILLVIQPWFLQFEYSRNNFPEDRFGFSEEDRIKYGIASLLYITESYPQNFLSNLSFESGDPIYGKRELDHMKDVQIVFQAAKKTWTIVIILYFLQIILFYRKASFQLLTRQILIHGSLLTIFMFILIFFVALFAFDPFFQFFHQLFFVENSWLFYESDTLIRLFPEKLWVDGFLLVSILTIITAVIFLLIGTEFSFFKKPLREPYPFRK